MRLTKDRSTSRSSARNAGRLRTRWHSFHSLRANSLRRAARRIRAEEERLTGLPDTQLTAQSNEIRDRCLGARQPHAEFSITEFAPLVAEAVRRVHGFQLHEVQLHALCAGFQNSIVEMQTGEGKTIVSGAIAACKATVSPAVHVGTTNAYLAMRDQQEMAAVFELLGLSCGLLPEKTNPVATRDAYSANITYGPGYQYGFDYLRDQVKLRTDRQSRLGRATLASITGQDPVAGLMQPPEHHVALIDEADSVMIDEALTPLVISGAARRPEDPEPFEIARQQANDLEIDTDYTIDSSAKQIVIDERALEKCHAAIAEKRHLQLARPWSIYIRNALRAQQLLNRNVDYVVQEEEVCIVDQFTGRIFSDRTWQDGLHQAVEAKEQVTIRSADSPVARVTRQRYLQMYSELVGLTGTASGVAREFRSVFSVPVVVIPTNRPCIRRMLPTRFFANTDAKVAAVIADIQQRTKTGQPILVGTRTIRESLLLFDALREKGIHSVVLNGLQNEDEAQIVSASGHYGSLTIATNMAGRGTDIKPDQRALATGGLHVIGFSPNSSPRIDRQLAGRAARQGNPGSAQFFVAADDEIIATHAPELARQIVRSCGRQSETRRSFSHELLRLQQRIEATQYKVRQDMIRQDTWMDLVRSAIEKE